MNGRLIPGGKHDRIDTWKSKIPPDAARRVATVGFLAAPSAGTLEQRTRLNQKEFQKDFQELKTGVSRGFDALYRTFIPPPTKQIPSSDGK